MERKTCRFCGKPLTTTFVDLGMSPLSNAFVREQDLDKGETFYPLHAYVCSKCHLVQLEEFESPESIFEEYAYFSSYSDSWLEHCRQYVERMTVQLKLNSNASIIEIASNDGYLLQYFKEKNFSVLGIEPAKNVAKVAQEKGIPTITRFFGEKTAKDLVSSGTKADLLIGNNVLAHVPDINDFVAGMKLILKENGVISMEFPHVLKLMKENQFDTIYHEHFSYLSLSCVKNIFDFHGLKIFHAEELSTHGGSLRIFSCHRENIEKDCSEKMKQILEQEREYGIDDIHTYQRFHSQVQQVKREILSFLIREKEKGKRFAGYGAAAKANTLLNYCGIRSDFIDYVVDKNEYKQGRYLPGTHIAVKSPEEIRKTKPDYVIILPWNLKQEIIQQNLYIKEWGGKFVVFIPEVEVL